MSKPPGALNTERLYVYTSVIRGSERFSLLYGAYPDRKSAAEAMETLPKSLRDGKPMIRSIGGIQSDRNKQ